MQSRTARGRCFGPRFPSGKRTSWVLGQRSCWGQVAEHAALRLVWSDQPRCTQGIRPVGAWEVLQSSECSPGQCALRRRVRLADGLVGISPLCPCRNRPPLGLASGCAMGDRNCRSTHANADPREARGVAMSVADWNPRGGRIGMTQADRISGRPLPPFESFVAQARALARREPRSPKKRSLGRRTIAS